MRRKNSLNNNYAVTEVIGGVLILAIAIITFVVVSAYLYPPPPETKINVDIDGFVNEIGDIILEHNGGETISDYCVIVRYPNGTYIGSKEYVNDDWGMGEKRYPLQGITDVKLTDDTVKLNIFLYSTNYDGSQETIFDKILMGNPRSLPPSLFIGSMLVPSLNTSTTDEDLICSTHTINTSLNVTTYIFKWMLNGYSLAQVLMPFDTENNNLAKDYSGDGYNGTVKDAEWTSNGKVGGCYYFDGASDCIEMDLPAVFEDLTRNDFTFCIWAYSFDISDNGRVIFEASMGDKYFAKLFQYDNQLHFGVCENDIRRAVRTEALSNNTWYHIATTWDSSTKQLAIHVNGVKSTEIVHTDFSMGTQVGLSIGHETSSSRYWWGYLDELQIFNFILSDEQIFQMYLSQKDGPLNTSIIVSQETYVGDIWQCIVIPNDGVQDDEATESNLLEIIPYPGGE